MLAPSHTPPFGIPHLKPVLALVPGVLLSLAVAAAAVGAEYLEARFAGDSYLESLVLAIIIGTAVRSLVRLPQSVEPGITFTVKRVMEVAIVLLGASISLQTLVEAGPRLVGGTAILVACAILVSYLLGKLFGLNAKLAMLVACGNSICGNSAIAAVAPVIKAESDDVAAAIAFTAVLGVVVVLALPLALVGLSMTSTQYGVLAGLTVYAVPQVLAAAQPGGIIAVQMGTLVKLIRVLMLGPVLMVLGFTRRGESSGSIRLGHILPWFIVGFAVAMGLRSAGAIPPALVQPLADASGSLTVLAMAALGLTVDIRSVTHASGRVLLTASLSIIALAAIGIGLILMLDVG